ncbi:MAG: hypothetical protein SPF70_12695 [Lachnospiraceae bacterium]|nr:hypothetical protein [Lachnospiraceae bacterium]
MMDDMSDNQNDLRRMTMLRAALPYIPVSMQKFLNIYLGLEELFNAIRTIRNGPVIYSECPDADKNKIGNTEELIKVLRNFCSPKENEMIDMFFQMSKMMSMYDNYKDILEGIPKPEPDKKEGMDPFSMLNMMKQFQGSKEVDDIFHHFME